MVFIEEKIWKFPPIKDWWKFLVNYMFEHFAKEKSDFLKKKDKSRKGCIDEDTKEIFGC